VIIHVVLNCKATLRVGKSI